ncbi:trypsin-like peptidase domain-containing protein [Streptomyces sp. NPDC050674]|uniref:trypsin-like peptidase domain-containing protein n=1 Tax=Streptomyces sp. NPDC050674 TaxID=3157216 RepID=UPI0034163596
MNEGKPTKAKWWSRPRPQDLTGEPEGTDGVAADDGAVNGPHESARVPAPADEPGIDGDFELARPLARPDEAGGDYELRRPEAAAEASAPVPAARTDQDAPVGPAEDARAGQDVPDAPAVPAEGARAGQDVPVAHAVPVEGAPRPLHDPDPYSTPPYGEPGPWAPAPPVQHPAATPAQGVPAPAPPTVPGTPAVPPPHGTPAQGMPGHATPPHGTPPAPDSGSPTLPAPAPAGPAHTDAAAPAPAPAGDPWQRYDPWAAPGLAAGHGPFQQNGAAVLSTEQRRKRGRKSLVLGAVLLALVSGGIGGGVGTYLERNGGVGTITLPQAGKEPSTRAADSVAGIAGRALPSVVTLHVSGAGEQGTGTGFVLDARGHILTNNHVVQPAGSGGEITVTFNGGESAQAEVVGRDSGYDLAVVKVKGVSGLTPLPLGNSDNVQVGDPVVAIGAPFDLAGTVTSGIISAKQRPITAGGEKGDGSDVSYVDALQTDAPINPGNSGGPLLDARARVIGINSAIRSAGSGSTEDSGRSGSIGLGFAIPINQGKRVAEELINTGKATHPVIGITLDMDYSGDGARVASEGSEGGSPVTPGGPGAKAGIKAGDVITEVGGQRVHSGEELIVKTRAHRPGDRLELTVERGGKERKVSLVLGSSGG